jgi:hypothetical protein
MGSIEDRVWSDLVGDHGAKLAEATWPSPKPHRRRLLGLAGIALVIVGVAVALGVELTGTATRPVEAVATGVPRSSLLQYVNMDAVVAEARIGKTTVLLAPSAKGSPLPGPMGKDLPPGGLWCFAVIGPRTGGLACGPSGPNFWDAKGTMLAGGPSDGLFTAWGYAPLGTTAVTVGGRSVRLFGRFFEASIPRGVHEVVFTTPTGPKQLATGS